jgi:hypothetical protein
MLKRSAVARQANRGFGKDPLHILNNEGFGLQAHCGAPILQVPLVEPERNITAYAMIMPDLSLEPAGMPIKPLGMPFVPPRTLAATGSYGA